MKRAIIIINLLLLFGVHKVVSQEGLRDSLYQAAQSLDDSLKLEAYNQYAGEANSQEDRLFWIDKLKAERSNTDSVYWNALILHQYANIAKYQADLDRCIELRKRAIKKFYQLSKHFKISRQYNNIGNAFADLAQYDSALYYYQLSLSKSIENKDSFMIGSSYLNISTIYNATGNTKEELANLMRSVDIAKKAVLEGLERQVLFNLAVYFLNQGELEKSEELIEEMKVLYQKDNYLYGFALLHNLKAGIAFERGDYDGALLELDSSMQYFKQLGYLSRVGSLQLNIGQVQAQMGRFDQARSTIWDAYLTFRKIGDLRYAAISMHDLASVLFGKELYKSSLGYFKEAIHLCDSLGILDLQAEYLMDLSEAHYKAGHADSSYFTLLEHIAIKDSLYKQNKLEIISEMETRFDTERKELEIQGLQKEKQLQESQLESKTAQNRLLYVGLSAALILVLIVSLAFVQKQKDNRLINSQKHLLEEQNEELNAQKEIVEEKNREITDSINYAKKIQEAVLASKELIKASLPKSFVLYLPKDIVAGDFYWMSNLKDSTLLAAADCTGHGVPGAMVSVVCSNALNRAVGEFGIEKPAEILNKCQELVVTDLGSSNAEIKDGMDIALCSFHHKDRVVEFAGAQNPLWIIGKKPKGEVQLLEHQIEGKTEKLYELKADKQSIGFSDDFRAFTNHQLELNPGDRLYFFSDGYLDQFGGERGKKLKSKNLKEILLQIQDLTIEEQANELKARFLAWKGDLEQLDDVCIIGVEV